MRAWANEVQVPLVALVYEAVLYAVGLPALAWAAARVVAFCAADILL